jgi:general L-amino acid transport system permease protein
MPLLFKHKRVREIVLQAGLVILVVALLTTFYLVAMSNMAKQGISLGFDFLGWSTGFELGYSIIPFSSYDSYGRALLAGMANTILLGVLGILFATGMGVVIAVLRLSKNPVLSLIGTSYVELFRNLPLLLQVLFWYAVFTNLPPPRQAYEFFSAVLISSRGFYFPALNVTPGPLVAAGLLVCLSLVAAVWIMASRFGRRFEVPARRAIALCVIGVGVLASCVLLAFNRIPEATLFDIPAHAGLNIRGGFRVPPELLTLITAITIYGGAYIGEIIRAGLMSVSRGPAEAAKALGLSKFQTFTRIRFPLAIRAMLPALTNQYVWLFKATAMGIVIGYSDFFMVTAVSIPQSGHTFELIGILMLGFLVMNNTISISLNWVNRKIQLKGTQLRS